MPISVPVADTELSVSTFGKPVVDEVNRLTALLSTRYVLASLGATSKVSGQPIASGFLTLDLTAAGMAVGDIAVQIVSGTAGHLTGAATDHINITMQRFLPDSSNVVSNRYMVAKAPVTYNSPMTIMATHVATMVGNHIFVPVATVNGGTWGWDGDGWFYLLHFKKMA